MTNILYTIVDWLLGIHKRRSATGKRLNIDMIPYGMHGKNVRAVLSSEQWRAVCTVTHKANRYRCVECGRDRNQARLECHESWQYVSSSTGTAMQISGLHTLCHECHMGKHIGLARKLGEYDKVKSHLMRVYGLSSLQFKWIEHKAIQRVKAHGGRVYLLDLQFLNQSQFRFLGRQFSSNELGNCKNISGNE